ncbi:MAG TPA: sulfotransferase [Acidimicrobiales bacterium]|nr:sulfotransferase [Acidimicrobiales bacterium]
MRVRLSTPARVLPHFLVLGAQRCGTSSLYKYLGRHPCIAPSLRKEVGYFTSSYGEDVGWYRAHFPLEARAKLMAKAGQQLLSFEATPDYLLHPLAPARVMQLLPDARFVVLLRDPVDRAFSHYLHMRRLGFETRTFERAIEEEPMTVATDLARIHLDAGHDPKQFHRFSYAARSRYVEQLERWMNAFPRERFLVLDSSALYSDPRPTYQEILRFLGLPGWSPKQFSNHSYVGSPAPAAPSMHPELRHQLTERFAEANQGLAELVGRDFPWNE